MQMLLDTVNLEQIRKLYNILPCDGVTTNPTILKRENKNPIETLKEIRRFLPESAQLHVQLLSNTSDHVLELCKYGIGAVTLSPEVVEQIYTLQTTIQAMDEFGKDFVDLCGEGKTMLNSCQ